MLDRRRADRYARGVDPLWALARAVLFRLDPERAHDLTLSLMARASRSSALTGLLRALYGGRPDPALGQTVAGLHFPTPIGLAAGLDKNGVAIDAWAALGFGFVEVGTVTPGHGQPGNDKPRLERLRGDHALVNRMGFNNAGADALAHRLAARTSTIPVGANLGKAKVTPNERAADDYAAALAVVWPYVDYVTLNVSSPNTPGLRDLQAVDALAPLVARVLDEDRRLAEQHGRPRRPIFLKIAPDLADEDVDRVADLALTEGLDGLIATNTTLTRPGLRQAPTIAGGLSGRPLRPRAHAVAQRLRARVGARVPIVGVGGLESGDDVYDRLGAGASLVQVYTALIYAGPSLVQALTARLLANLRRDGYHDVARLIGART